MERETGIGPATNSLENWAPAGNRDLVRSVIDFSTRAPKPFLKSQRASSESFLNWSTTGESRL